MIERILNRAGVEYRETRFPKPPAETYAVYMDDITTDGADDSPSLIRVHDYTVEVYEPRPDPDTEQAIEAALDEEGVQWTKQARYWLREEQRYQVIYEFTYFEKRRISHG